MEKFILFIILFFAIRVFAVPDLTENRVRMIVNAFNEKSQDLIRPLTAQDIRLGETDGRADVNEIAKLSYYIQIDNVSDSMSPLTMIPMATSRFTPTFYQTDEWWNANKNAIDEARRRGTPTPRQDPEEVRAWLKDKKLSTNPDVLQINPATGKVTRTPLQKFLLDHYIKNYDRNGFMTLFRGAEKAGESEAWASGSTPRGVRYWTPTANYAWRYARKNTLFLDEMMKGQTPVFKFKIPTAVFKQMVEARYQDFTLGTELTKRVHDMFNASNQFQDQLFAGQPYAGEGNYGVEFEIRSSRYGAQRMAGYYQGTATMDDLVNDRIDVLNRTKARLQAQKPHARQSIGANFDERIRNVRAEGLLIKALQENYPDQVVLKALAEVRDFEITRIDGVRLNTWTQTQLSQRLLKHPEIAGSKKTWEDLLKSIRMGSPGVKECQALF